MPKEGSNEKPKKPFLDITENKFLRKYAQIIYAVILIILIPAIIIGNSVFIINRFRNNTDIQLQRQALLITEIINTTVIESTDDFSKLQGSLERLFTGPEEISSMDILVPDGEGFKIIASGIESNVGKNVSGVNSVLAWHNDRAIAHLTRPSSEDIRLNPRLTDARFWNVVAPLHNIEGEKVGLMNLKMSLEIVDDLTKQTLVGSYLLLFGTLIVIMLLLLVNTRLFQYALLFKKLKEVDEMKDEFISMASHELRTPITAISGYISMFQDGSFGTLSGAGQKGIAIVQASTQRLASLIEDLLNVSRIEQGRLQMTFEDIDLNTIIQETIQELKITAEAKKLALNYTPAGSPSHVSADKDRLKQVLINIIGNAIKYTKEGSVTITIDSPEDSGMMRVKIKDTGIGMSAKDREQLFEKFYRIKNDETRGIVGTGLGLWITKQIVNLMGGEIYVDSMEKSGTEVSFTLKKSKRSHHS